MKVRAIQVLAMLLLSWSVSGVTGAEAAAGKEMVKAGAKEWPVLPYLPRETLVVLSLKDASKSFERLKHTGLWKLYSQPTAQNALSGPLQKLRGKLKVVKQAMGHDLLDVVRTMKGEVTIGLLGFLEERNDKGEPIPDLLVAFQPRDKKDAWMDEWDRFIDALNDKTENTLEINETVFAGANVINVSHPAAPFEITYCMTDGVFLASLGPGRVENILASRAAAKKKGEAEESFAASPRFKQAVDAVGGDYDALLHVGFAELRKVPELKIRPKNPKEERDWKAMGLYGLNALSYGLSFQGDMLKETIFVDAPSAKATGLLGLLSAGGNTGVSVDFAPKDAVAALSLNLNPREILERFIELASAENPGVRKEVEDTLAKMGEAVQLNLPGDLFAAFSGQIDFSLSIAPVHPKVRVSFPRPILSLGLKDAALAGKVLDALKAASAETMGYRDFPHQGKVITLAREKYGHGKDPGQFCYSIIGNNLIMSLYPLALKNEINRLAKVEEPTLESTTEYQAVAGRETSTSHALVYLDTGAIASTLYSVLIPIVQMQQKSPKFLDINTLPPADVLAEILKSSLITLKKSPAGLTIESRSSTGLWSTALPVVGLMQEAIKKNRRKRESANPKLTSNRSKRNEGEAVAPPTAPPDF